MFINSLDFLLLKYLFCLLDFLIARNPSHILNTSFSWATCISNFFPSGFHLNSLYDVFFIPTTECNISFLLNLTVFCLYLSHWWCQATEHWSCYFFYETSDLYWKLGKSLNLIGPQLCHLHNKGDGVIPLILFPAPLFWFSPCQSYVILVPTYQYANEVIPPKDSCSNLSH